MDRETIFLAKQLKQELPRNYAIIMASSPTSHGTVWQIGVCPSDRTPPLYSERSPHWEFTYNPYLTPESPHVLVTRHPDGSHSFTDENISTLRIASVIKDTVEHLASV